MHTSNMDMEDHQDLHIFQITHLNFLIKAIHHFRARQLILGHSIAFLLASRHSLVLALLPAVLALDSMLSIVSILIIKLTKMDSNRIRIITISMEHLGPLLIKVVFQLSSSILTVGKLFVCLANKLK